MRGAGGRAPASRLTLKREGTKGRQADQEISRQIERAGEGKAFPAKKGRGAHKEPAKLQVRAKKEGVGNKEPAGTGSGLPSKGSPRILKLPPKRRVLVSSLLLFIGYPPPSPNRLLKKCVRMSPEGASGTHYRAYDNRTPGGRGPARRMEG